MRFRIGKVLKGLGTVAAVATGFDGVLRQQGVSLPPEVDVALKRLRALDVTVMVAAESAGVKALDEFFDRAQESRCKVVLQAVAEDGDVLHVVELTDAMRAGIDLFFDELEKL
jgi:ABC-type transporter Mla MlaB component